MKTFIFCTSYMDRKNHARYKKWVDYYCYKLNLFNSSHLVLIDDGSPAIFPDDRISITKAENLPDSLQSRINIFHFEDRLGRSSMSHYPGWWRSFTYSIKLAEFYDMDKIIHIESDFYVVSRRMIDYIAKKSNGWTGFFSRYYNLPETAIQVICKDSFKAFDKLKNKAVELDYNFGKPAEHVIPFTQIERGFYGDRLGELEVLQGWLNKITPPLEVDYVGQMNEKHDLKDLEPIFRFDFK